MNFSSLLLRSLLIIVVAVGLVACGGDETGPQSTDEDTGPSIDRSTAVEESLPDDEGESEGESDEEGVDEDQSGASTTNQDQPAIAQSPAANNPVPEGMDDVGIRIEGGEMEGDDLSFQVEENIVITIGNADDRAYKFQIDGLTEPREIPAGEITTIELNASTADTYTGQLLGEDNSVISEIDVEVQSASGAS